jgi:streptogramin lyase
MFFTNGPGPFLFGRGSKARSADKRASRRSSRRRLGVEGLESRCLLSATPTIRDFPIPTPVGDPAGITAGPDGSLWFAELEGNRIGRITPAGAVTEFSAGISPGSRPNEITTGPDGNLWFTEGAGNRIGRITPAGAVTEFSAGISPGGSPFGITAGPDGNLWFAEANGSRIGRITPAGVVTEFSAGITPGSQPFGITAGLDGNLWFAEGNAIGRITPAGAVTEFSAGIAPGHSPALITAGPDGNLWFTEQGGGIGRITTAGAITEFSAGIAPGSNPTGITLGPDGNLWFTAQGAIGRITTAGAITEFSAGLTAGTDPDEITAGPDGKLWFTDLGGNQIGQIDLHLSPAGSPATEFIVPTQDGLPNSIVRGPDGNLWFTEFAGPLGDVIGRISPTGQITEFHTGAFGSQPSDITLGPDGNLWFTELNGGIGRITPAGQVTRFPTPTPFSQPIGITAGPDGNLWFAEIDAIGRITPTGVVTEFRTGLGIGGQPNEITAGPDGNLWFTGSGVIGRITPSGTITRFTAGITPGSFPGGITGAPDGNLWFTDAGAIGRITTAGVVTLFNAGLAPGSDPALITAGPDGNLWFTEHDAIGRITPAGQISVFSADITPTNGEGLHGITVGPDGNLWFTERTGNRIGRLQLPPTTAAVADGGFEAPGLGAGSFQYAPAGTPWTFMDGAGISGNGSGFTAGNPNAPEGAQVAFLQGNGSFRQTVDGLAAGTYRLTFQAAQRGNFQASRQDFRVLVDGVLVGIFTPAGTGYAGFTTAAFTVGAGAHSVIFQGLDSAGGDNTAFVDDVQLAAAAAPALGDAGFESPAVGSGSFGAFQYDPAGTPWAFVGNAGIAGNGSGFTAGNPNAPEGAQVAFLQGNGSFRQTIAGLAAGTYQLSFQAAQRGNFQASRQNFRVLVDGLAVGFFTPEGTAYSALATTFTVGAGAHTITFQGLNGAGGDNTAFIDDVRLATASALGDAGFESPAVGGGSFGAFQYDPEVTWAFFGTAGISGNGSGFTAGNPNAPEGAQVAFLQGTGSFSQAIANMGAGTYRLTFQAAQRGNFQASRQDFRVLVDGVAVGTFAPAGTAYQQLTTAAFAVGAGVHTITFAGLDSAGGDNTAFIDNIQLT